MTTKGDLGYKNKVTPECEVFFENDVDTLETRYKNCEKNPEHENFLSVDTLTVNDLPLEFRTTNTIHDIFLRCALTVRVKVHYTSPDRPAMFPGTDTPYPFYTSRGNNRAIIYGTGSIVEVYYHQPITGKPCPCRVCQESDEPKTVFWWVRARTATHVIHDRSEAQRAEFACFFDSDGSPGVKTIYGFDTFNIMNRYARTFRYDVCDVLCATHDHAIAAMFNAIIPASTFLNPPVHSPGYSPSKIIVSHPHGCSKRITIANVLQLTVPTGPDYPTNEPIMFKKGIYRQVKMKRTESENNAKVGRRRPLEPGDALLDLDANVCIMKEKLNALRDSIDPRDALKISRTADITNLTAFGELDPRQRCTVQVYLLFIRQHILKILVHAAIVDQKCKGGVVTYEQQVKNAFDEFFRTFLGKEYHPKMDFKVEKDSDAAHISRLQYWVSLLRESEDDFIQFKSRHVSGSRGVRQSESVIVAWFHEVEIIMDSMILDEKKKGVSLSEDMLPALIDRTLQAGLEILAIHDDNQMSKIIDQQTETEGAEMEKEDDVKEEETKGAEMEKEDDVKEGETEGAEMEKEDDVKEEETKGAEMEKEDDVKEEETKGAEIEKEDDVKEGETEGAEMEKEDDAKEEETEGAEMEKEDDVKEGETKGAEMEKEDDAKEGETEGAEMEKEDDAKEGETEGAEMKKEDDAKEEETEGAEMKKEDDAKEEETEGAEMKKEDDAKEEETEGAEMEKEDDAKEEETEGAEMENHGNENQILEGSSFTLPTDAEYAFRVHSRSPGWFTFPPGTTMTLPDGTQKYIGVDSFEFKNLDIQPQQCFVTYNARTCPGSSGANVYCDILGPHLGTYYPHSGHTGGNIHQSGIRHHFYTLYTKMALHKAQTKPEHRKVQTTKTIIEGSKSFIQTLKEKLRKH